MIASYVLVPSLTSGQGIILPASQPKEVKIVFNGDAGSTSPSGATTRHGIELAELANAEPAEQASDEVSTPLAQQQEIEELKRKIARLGSVNMEALEELARIDSSSLLGRMELPVQRVLADVRGGFVSRESAERDYGVILDADGRSVDGPATAKRRADRPSAALFHQKGYRESLS